MKKNILISIFLILVLMFLGQFFVFLKKYNVDKKDSVEKVVVVNKDFIEEGKNAVIRTEVELPKKLDTSDWKKCQNLALGIELSYPSTWGDCTVDDSDFTFRTNYTPYDVDLSILVRKNNPKDNGFKKNDGFIYEDIEGGRIFQDSCGGPLACNVVILGDDLYYLGWSIESSQKAPDNLDEIWVPDHNVDNVIIWNILRTVKEIDTDNECSSEYCISDNKGNKIPLQTGVNQYSSVARWGDWFFYGIKNDGLFVLAINLESGEKKEIFNYNDMLDVDKKDEERVDLAVINDDLYITLGGYIVEGKVYFIDLNLFSKPQLIIKHDIRFQRIEDTIIGVFIVGDAGVGFEEYFTFDKINRQFKKIVEVRTDMGVGEEVVFYDNKKFVIARAKSDNTDDFLIGNIYYDSFYSINVDTLEKTELGQDYIVINDAKKWMSTSLNDYLLMNK